jgi:hypothetical protein
MSLRLFAVAAFSVAASAISPQTAAVGLQLNDGCGVVYGGTLNGSLGADAGGNINVTGFAMNVWVAGPGYCEAALPGGSTPRCTLLASHTNAEPNVPVTFHARCRQPAGQVTTTRTWTGPAGGPAFPGNAASIDHMQLTFPAKGSYTFTFQAANGYGMGPTSTPVTVLVGNPAATSDGPSCEAKFSPSSIVQGGASQAIVSCQPPGASVAWDPPEAGAPAASGVLPVLTFPGPGNFTYKLRVANASGTYGPKIGATINVVSNGSCVPGPYAVEYAIPGSFSYSPDAAVYPNQTVAFSFSVASGANAQIALMQHPAYTTYTFPQSGDVAISKCRGDFNVPAACVGFMSPYWNTLLPATNSPYASPGTCMLEPNVQYFVNVRGTNCSNSPYGMCGFKIYRSQ